MSNRSKASSKRRARRRGRPESTRDAGRRRGDGDRPPRGDAARTKRAPPRRPARSSADAAGAGSAPTAGERDGVTGVVQSFELGRGFLEVETAAGSRFAVSAAVPGDRLALAPTVDGTLGDEDRSLPRAEVRAVLAPAADRITAPCAVLERCGACTLQQMRYGAQLRAKAAALRELLDQLGGSPHGPPKIAGLSRPVGYRTRLLMPAAGRGRTLRFGFYRRGTFSLTRAEGCPVQHPLTLALLAQVRQVLCAHDVAATHDGRRAAPSGWLHGIAIRVSEEAGEVTLLARHEQLPDPRLVEQLIRLPGLDGLHLSTNPKRSSYLMGETVGHLAGAPRLSLSLCGERFALSPATFFQTCTEGAELLARAVLDALPQRCERLADLYGGAGIFTRLARGRWREALVIESNPSAIGDLREALAARPLGSIQLVCNRVEGALGQLSRFRPDAVIVDPPRRGCHPRVIAALAKIRPRAVIYVACGARALLRDGRALLAAGYRLQRAAAIDMFAHTPHLEIAATFEHPHPV